MSFLEVEFPRAIAFLAKGGPAFSTTVNKGFSGAEQRNQNWALALGKWEIALNLKPQTYFQNVYDFFLNVGGKANAFRFYDAKDCQAFAQPIGIGAAGVTQFQLQRTYAVGSSSYVKPVCKPITSAVMRYDGSYLQNTVVVYVNGVAQGAGWTVDFTTGIVTFAAPPAPGAVITADFQFNYPARFDTDECNAIIEESDVEGGNALITWSDVQLVEVATGSY